MSHWNRSPPAWRLLTIGITLGLCHQTYAFGSDELTDTLNIALIAIGGVALIALVIVLRLLCVQSKRNRTVAHQPENMIDIRTPTPDQQLSWRIDPSEVEIGAMVGQGSVGTVHQGKWKSLQVAVKVISHNGKRENLEHDLRSLIRVRHPSLVLFMGIAALDDPRPDTATTPTASLTGDARRRRAGSISTYVSIEQYLNITSAPPESEPSTPTIGSQPLQFADASTTTTPLNSPSRSLGRRVSLSDSRRKSVEGGQSTPSLSVTTLAPVPDMGHGGSSLPNGNSFPASSTPSSHSTPSPPPNQPGSPVPSTSPLQHWFKRDKKVSPPSSLIFMVTEYMQRGSLQSCLLDSSLPLGWSSRVKLALDVARAMHYLHCSRPPILHRALSSSNVLVDQDLTAKVSDYGLDSVRKVAKSRGAVVEEPYWCAPEVLKSGRYSSASDVYSFGMILWELLTRTRPTLETPGTANTQTTPVTPRPQGGSLSNAGAAVNYLREIKAITKGARPAIPSTTPAEMAALIRACWQHDPRKRPNFAVIIDVLTPLKSLEFDVSQLEPLPVVIVPFATRTLGAAHSSMDGTSARTSTSISSLELESLPSPIQKDRNSISVTEDDAKTTLPIQPTSGSQLAASNTSPAATPTFKPSLTLAVRAASAPPPNKNMTTQPTEPPAKTLAQSSQQSGQNIALPLSSYAIQPQAEAQSKAVSGNRDGKNTKASRSGGALVLTAPWLISPEELTYESRIGAGSFGEVYSGTFRGKRVAIKKLASLDAMKWHEFAHELDVMCALRHPGIVLFMGACLEPGHQCLVMELCEHGSLFDILHDSAQVIDYRRILSILTNIAEAMAYLHANEPPILHRDLKSANILIDESMGARVSDFGLTRFKPRRNPPPAVVRPTEGAGGNGPQGRRLIVKPSAKEQQHQQQKQHLQQNHQSAPRTQAQPQLMGTLLWQAPEVLENQQYTQASDVYSFGIIIWELFTRRVPFADMNPHQATLAVVLENARPIVPAFIPPKFKELIESCWHHQPSKRPTFTSILQQLKQLEQLGLPRVNLTQDNAKLYAKRAAVFAFVSRDVVIVHKPWGTGESKRGDYVIVGPNDDVYTCDAAIFKKTYRPVDDPRAKNKYRKSQLILAVEQSRDFLMETLEGMEHGMAGDYIAQNPEGGEQWPIARKTFEEMYVLADDNEVKAHEERHLYVETGFSDTREAAPEVKSILDEDKTPDLGHDRGSKSLSIVPGATTAPSPHSATTSLNLSPPFQFNQSWNSPQPSGSFSLTPGVFGRRNMPSLSIPDSK